MIPKKIPLQYIIQDVLKEKGIYPVGADDAPVQGLRRGFYTMIESMGGNIDAIKAGGRKIGFIESEVPFIKIIIRQLYDSKGLAAKFIDKKSDISSIDVRDLIQSIIDEAAKSGASEAELASLGLYLEDTFHYTHIYFAENCHMLIDTLLLHLQDLDNKEQALYLAQVEHIFKKEVNLRIANAARRIRNIAEFKQGEAQRYYESDPEIMELYIKRDQYILEKIQEDSGLRRYIEGKFGKKAEEIFNYAKLNDKT